MVIISKKKFIELIAQVFSGEPEKTYEQINIERVLNGQKPFILDPKHLTNLNTTCWLFGFVASHTNEDDLVDTFVHGFKHNWFFHDKTNDDYIGLLSDFVFDLITVNNELYTVISDYIISNFPDSILRRNLIDVAFGTGLTNYDFHSLKHLHTKYSP